MSAELVDADDCWSFGVSVELLNIMSETCSIHILGQPLAGPHGGNRDLPAAMKVSWIALQVDWALPAAYQLCPSMLRRQCYQDVSQSRFCRRLCSQLCHPQYATHIFHF